MAKYGCYIKLSGNTIATNNWTPCFQPNTTNQIAQCCVWGDICYSDGMCGYTHSLTGGSGYYKAGCTDSSYNDAECPRICSTYCLSISIELRRRQVMLKTLIQTVEFYQTASTIPPPPSGNAAAAPKTPTHPLSSHTARPLRTRPSMPLHLVNSSLWPSRQALLRPERAYHGALRARQQHRRQVRSPQALCRARRQRQQQRLHRQVVVVVADFRPVLK